MTKPCLARVSIVRAGEGGPPEAAVDDDRSAFATAPDVGHLVGVVAVGDGLEAGVALLRPVRELGQERVAVHGASL